MFPFSRLLRRLLLLLLISLSLPHDVGAATLLQIVQNPDKAYGGEKFGQQPVLQVVNEVVICKSISQGLFQPKWDLLQLALSLCLY